MANDDGADVDRRRQRVAERETPENCKVCRADLVLALSELVRLRLNIAQSGAFVCDQHGMSEPPSATSEAQAP
jgi:hypothetical protein